jgi:enoyl-[acyl-carrier-protein] reductase (NADH)
MEELIKYIPSIITLLCFSSGISFGIFKLLIEKEAKVAVKPDLDRIEQTLLKLEDGKQCKEFCQSAHANQSERFERIESLLEQILQALLNK